MSWFEEETLEQVSEECQFWQQVELKQINK